MRNIPEVGIKEILIDGLKTLMELIETDRNSIWSYILKNILKPVVLLRRKFKFVIGNPPWLALRFMMDSNYQQFLKDETFHYKLIGKNQTHLIPYLEMATLFYCKISDMYLQDDGKISFVMPKSVLSDMQHRRFIGSNFLDSSAEPLKLKFETILDLEGVDPLFNIPSYVLMARKGKATEYPVPKKSFIGSLPSRNVHWLTAKKLLKTSTTTFSPLRFTESKEDRPYHSLFFQGAIMVPRNFWFVSIQSDPMFGLDPDLPYVTSSSENDSRKPWKSVILEGNVETESLYGTILDGLMVSLNEFDII